MRFNTQTPLRSSGNVRQWIVLAGALVILGMLLASSRHGAPSKIPDTKIPVDAAVVKIVFNNTQQPRAFSGPVVEGMTVANALEQAARAGSFSVAFDDKGMPATIDDVAGFWTVLRNGQTLQTSLAATPITAGDEIVFTAKGT